MKWKCRLLQESLVGEMRFSKQLNKVRGIRGAVDVDESVRGQLDIGIRTLCRDDAIVVVAESSLQQLPTLRIRV